MAKKSSNAQWLIDVGFEINEEELKNALGERGAQKLLSQVKSKVLVLQQAFKTLGADMSGISKSGDITKVVDRLENALKKVAKSQDIIVKSFTDGNIEIRKQISQTATQIETLTKSGAWGVSSNKEVVGADVNLAKSLGIDDVTALKAQISDSLSQSNETAARFLKENINNLDKYVSQVKTVYDEDTGNTRSWVEFKIDELNKLSMSIKGLGSGGYEVKTETITSKQQTEFEKRKSDESELIRLKQQEFQIDQQITQARSRGNTELEAALSKQKESLGVAQKEAEYTLKYGVSDEVTQLNEQLRMKKELSVANQEYYNRQLQIKDSISDVSKGLKEYNSLQSQYNKLTSDSSEHFNELELVKQKMVSLKTSLESTNGVLLEYNDDSKSVQATLSNTKEELSYTDQQYKQLTDSINAFNIANKSTAVQKADSVDTQQVQKAVELYKEYSEAVVNAKKVELDKFSTTPQKDEAIRKEKELGKAVELSGNAALSSGKKVKDSEKYIEQKTIADKKATTQVAALTRENQKNGISFNNLKVKVQDAVKQVLQYGMSFNVLYRVDDIVRQSVTTINDLDKALTNVRIVTGETTSAVHETLNAYAALGQELGATTKEVAEGSIEWLRQGKTAAETTELLRQSTILSKLGMIESAEATEKMTATLNGFGLAASDAASIVDKLVAVDLDFATSSNEIATALQYTASSAALAGVGLDKLIGMITVVSETTRKSAETIGNSLNESDNTK